MDHCIVGSEEKVEASVFNQAVKNILAHGVKAAMDKRGFGYKKVSVDGKKIWMYVGVRMTDD